MTDLVKLRKVADGVDIAGVHPSLKLLADAARAYADLLENGRQVQWCEEHLAPLLSTDRETGEQFCWKHHMNFIPSDVPYTSCRIVSKLLTEGPE
jgi:hypothetical protein